MNMIERAETLVKKNPGYSYSPAKLAEIINANVLPEGVPLMAAGGMEIRREGEEAVCYKGGVATKRTKIDEAGRQQLLISYAVLASQTGYKVGV
jgi:hypothetical protein